MRIHRFLAVLILLVVALPAGVGVASAQTVTDSYADTAGEALLRTPVYVHPEASSELSSSEADQIESAISGAGAGPVYIAILPEAAKGEAGGSVDGLISSIIEVVRRPGVYVVVAGRTIRAGATERTQFKPGAVPALATQAAEQNRGGRIAAVLLTFVDLLGREVRGENDSGSGISPFFLLLLAGGGGAMFISARRRKKQRAIQEKKELEEVREVALDDLVALGDDLRALDLDVEMPSADPAAKQQYVNALGSYEKATAALDRAQRPEDLREVASTIDEGRYSIECTKARLEGRPLPERRSPCFFDARHGQSVRDVSWAPPDGMPRDVPACAADAARVEAGEDPEAREISVGGRRVPYWDAPYYYGPWAGGYYGGFGMGGGLFQGMLLGSIFSGGFGGYGYGYGGGWGDGGGGDGGGGDFGGGFGGGDFGGDFGGGDFGGGDF